MPLKLKLELPPSIDYSTVCIGDVCIDVPISTKHPERVPPAIITVWETNYTLLSHLKWIMSKDLLGQDMFLIGSPGPFRRRLAKTYVSLVNRECEILTLHRDTSADSDLKQRREIVCEGSNVQARWIDSIVVNAAIEGRFLIIEGII